MRPTPFQIHEARALLADPERAAARPGARGLAWATLKVARGQTHCLRRLTAPAPAPAAPVTLAARLAETAESRRRRIHARAAQLGLGPTGGDAA